MDVQPSSCRTWSEAQKDRFSREEPQIMVDKNLKLLKILRCVYEIMVMLHFNFRLMLCSREDLLLKTIGQNMLDDI